MSVLGTIYTSLSGMMSYSKGLDVISDNVANMNTPGFKGSNVQFQDLFYQQHITNATSDSFSISQIGSGVRASSTTTSFAQGEIRETGTQTDSAINGNGYFVLLNDKGQYYTRAGQFDFNATGHLISKTSGDKVAGMNAANQLTEISIAKYRSNPPEKTSKISFVGNLSTGGTTHTLDTISVYDLAGSKQKLKVNFTNNNGITPRSWLIEVLDENENVISEGEIRFQGDGSPEVDFNEHKFVFTPDKGVPIDLTLSFGEPGSFTGSTSFTGGTTSTLATDTIDGYGIGSISKIDITEKGEIEIKYSNDQSATVGKLALAHFENQQALQKKGNGVYINPIKNNITLGSASDSLFGSIVGGSLELSNVELTQQFTDLVIIQRGYQSSSQVLTVANEMVQELINNTKGRG